MLSAFDQTDVGLCIGTHLLAVQASVVSLENNELLTGNVETGALDLLDIGSVLECGDNLVHLLGRDLQRSTRSAHALSKAYPTSRFHISISFSNPSERCNDGETHIKAGRSGPDAVAFAVEDGGLVNVASADQAVRMAVSDDSKGSRDSGVYLWSTYAVDSKVSP